MPDSTFAFAYTRAYVHACVSECVHVTGTTERHTATPRSRISISIPSLYNSIDLSHSRSASLSFSLDLRH